MQRLFLALFTAFIAFALPMQDAEAKRFGGGRSSGMQRDSLPQKQAAPAPTNPAGAAGAAAPAGKRSWLGPVAGLAAGLGLAALASHLGLGEEFANIMLITLLAMAALFLFKYLTRRKNPAPAMQYAGAGAGGGVTPFPAQAVAGGAAAPAQAANLPADFDAEAFTRQAKLNFIRLQAASDAGNLDDIRDFTSPEMYAEFKLQLAERGSAAQRTEVMMLEAEVLECIEEANRLLVSVRFHGLIREEENAPAADFNEVWHLTKPTSGKGGWVVAGIQQMQ
jgi:predicted lipid-binding transport protein (Tim44 family)